jgi:hypothetical protein
MASVKNGQITKPPQAWRHLRWAKRKFWKVERRACKAEAKREAARS